MGVLLKQLVAVSGDGLTPSAMQVILVQTLRGVPLVPGHVP